MPFLDHKVVSCFIFIYIFLCMILEHTSESQTYVQTDIFQLSSQALKYLHQCTV